MLWHWTNERDPLRELSNLHRQMDQVFGALVPGRGWVTRADRYRPAVNVFDKGDAYLVEAELPGLAEDDINIEATETSLTLSGQRKVEAPEGYRVHRRERRNLEFARSFELPAKVDLERVTATMKHGVLRIELPKQAQTRPRQISIKAS